MKSSILTALVAVVLPLTAMAQSLPQKKADLEEALRIRQFICSGIADVSARGASDYSSDDLVHCRATLDAQRAEYQRFMTEYASAQPAVPPARQHARTRTADAAH